MQKVNRNRQHNTFTGLRRNATREHITQSHICTQRTQSIICCTRGGQTSLQATLTDTLGACVCGAINILCALSLSFSRAAHRRVCMSSICDIFDGKYCAFGGGMGGQCVHIFVSSTQITYIYFRIVTHVRESAHAQRNTTYCTHTQTPTRGRRRRRQQRR